MSSDEEDTGVIQPPEFDAKVTLAIIDALQKRGSNVLMDELIDAADADEWEVARVLDVLVAMNVAAIEKQRGNTLRNSRAFAYRNGYALPKQVKLDTLSDDIAEEEATANGRLENIQKLKAQLEKGKSEGDTDFLRSFRQSKQRADLTTALLDKVL
jgi:hypothetical protein